MKTRSVLIIFFCLAAIHASAQLFVSQDKRDVAFQGQQSFKSPQTMRTVSNYVGTVYTPFGSEVPSDQSGIGSNSNEGGKPGHIRKGKILGPDTDPANQSPIGEPWILLAFATLFAAIIAWRKKNRKLEIYKPNNHDESKNTKDMNNFFKNQMNYDGRTTVERRSNNGQSQGHYTLGLTKLIFTITLLLTLAVGQMGAKTVYFKNTSNWTASNVKCHYWGGSSGTSWPGATMTRIGSTAYYKQDIGNNTMCIFNNNGNNQTADQTAQDGKICYYNSNSPYWNYGSRTGFTIYFDIRNVTNWGTPYLRVGRADHNSAYSMSLVAGTKYLYSVSSPGYDNYSAYTIANSQGWTNSHTIYQPSDEKPTGNYAITKLINYQNSNILENNVYFQATSVGSTSDGADYWNVDVSSSLPSYTVTYSYTGSGTLSVTKYNGSSYDDLSSGSSVNPTQIIKITATPSSGYGLGSLSVSGATKIGDTDTYYVTGNTTISVTFEVTHDVTISYKCSTATIKTSTTETSVGTSTPRSITAPDIDGYTFSSWTKGSGITIKSGTTSTATISITSGASGNTLQANYTAKACNLYKFNAAKNGTGSSVGSMTFDVSTLAYYKDITTNSSPYYFRFNFNSGTYYSTDWSAKTGTEAYTKGKTVVANGEKVDCNQNVTSWDDKPSIVFNGLNSSAIRIWFDYQNKKVWITETTYTVTVNNGDHGTVSPNGSQSVGKNSGISITASPSTGYNFTSWSKTGSAVLSSTTANPTTVTATGTGTVTATYTAKQYTITLNNNGGEGGTSSVKATYNSSTLSTAITNPTMTGYTFNGWHKTNGSGQLIINTGGALQAGTDYTGAGGIWTNDGAVTLYAGWTPKTTTVSFSQSGEGYGSGGQSTTKTATYDAAMPTPITCPTAANGYAFMGYFGAANGEGTQYYNADGTSAHNWDQEGATATLYAYFKKAEITVAIDQSVFEPVAAGGSSWVQATPTVEPEPVGPVKICWALLYDDENPVPAGHDPVTVSGNVVKFNLAGLAAGSYRIRATLRTGSSCGSGTLLSTFDKTVTIANEFTVTVKYMCGTEEIKASTTTPGKATEWTSIDAPDIFGYTFSTWDLGDGGITKHESDALTKKTGFRFKASYNGTLTAKYNKNKYIYLDLSQTFGSGKWSNPYCYLYNSDGYWDNTQGAGATGGNCVKKGAMTQITGTDIWYFDYSDASAFIAAENNGKLAFTWGNHMTQANFGNVDAIYRTDFSEGTPLFIPAVGQNKEDKSTTCCGTGHYYNRGYWTNYTGSKTGYTLLIYNSSDVEIKRIPFNSVSNDMRMTMKATVDLEAATTYKVEILRDNGHYYKNNGARNFSNSQVNWEYREDLDKGNLLTTAAGDYVFTLSYVDMNSDHNFQIRMKVDYPAAVNDFQVMYNDNATWSLGTAHGSNWRHPSRMIKARANGVDTISFFVAKTNSPKLYARKVTNASSMTWASLNIADAASMNLSVDSSAVYNFKVTQGSAGVISSIENIGAYTGEYYIRCDAMNSKWDNYTSDNDHRMTYSSFSESDANAFGEKFSHYKAKWCKYGKNVKFVIANDYSPCISDTLTQDVPNTYNNIDSYGFLKNDGTADETKNIYSANIRFMWNRKTNKISRAYVASSTNPERLFLVLRGNYAIHGQDGSDIEDEGTGIPSVILQDDQNWMYEEILYIKPGTRFKLYACYAQVSANPDGAQYFRGAYDSNRFTTDANSVILIDGDGDYQKARVLYDFKTNRLICAWLPSNADVSGTNNINADVMIIREHQEAAQYITFADADSKLTGVKTVYGVMKFNRWVLNNRKSTGTHQPLDVGDQKSEFERSLYFISFPFDVRVSDIFGFGHYWDEWYLEYYDGLTRAKNGFWIDSPPNWKCVTPEMATNYVLKANEGYILGLDLEYMPYNNEEFWAHDIETIELFFPSTAELATLQQTTCTIPALSSDYKCTINRTGEDGDRRVKDSYWRCIGTPSLNLYNTAVTDGSGNAISWKTDYTWHADEREFPFIYMWNKTDNTLTPQSTSTFNFLPMHSYLVQNGGQIVWTNVSAKSSSIVARNTDDTPAMSYNWRLALISDTTLIDQTYVRMNNLEQVTDTFDFGQDMSKEFNPYRSDIYTKIGYERVAANSMPLNTETTTIVPVGIKVYKAGEFKLAMPDGTDGIGITLVDNENGIRTQLGALDYTVTLDRGTYDERFYLEISPIHNTPTGMENGGSIKGENGVRKVIIDQNMYIIRDGKMYDARGARVE